MRNRRNFHVTTSGCQTNSPLPKIVSSLRLVLVIMALPIIATAQDSTTKDTTTKDGRHTKHVPGESTRSTDSLAKQLRALQLKVSKLEAGLKQKQAGKMGVGRGSAEQPMPMRMGKGMGMKAMPKPGMSGMGMMKKMPRQGMPGQGMGGKAGGGKPMSGMAMMGQMKGMGAMQMPSALPGFAGASHIYHIGATSFFLDHTQHITLTQEQQAKLNQVKEKGLLGQGTFDRWISQAEQELWVLTSSDVPDAAKIEAKIREIEKLRGDKRIAYIRAVGDAAQVLTDEQRQSLIGTLPPTHKAVRDDPEPRNP